MEKTNDKQWTRAMAFIVLVMWMGLSSALAQNAITVKGQVLDAKNKEPLIGVSVLERVLPMVPLPISTGIMY